MQPNYKLIYFDARGRAELSRLIFVAAGVKFEDKRVSREEWPALKPAMPFGQLPVLSINDKLFSQSSAIENFLAREFALYGKSSLEGLKIEEVIGIVHDYRGQMVRWYVETDNDRKEELYKSLQEQHLPRFLNIIERKLRNNVRGYIVGDRISLADLAVYDILEETSRRYPDVLDNFPQVKEHRIRIQSSQKISDYLKNRKETEF